MSILLRGTPFENSIPGTEGIQLAYFVLAGLCFAATPCQAQYKCVENGRTTYAERPCSPNSQPVSIPSDHIVTPAEREQAADRLKRQKKVAAEIDTTNAKDSAEQRRRGEVFAEAQRAKKERCAELLRIAKGAQDEAQTYRYHQGLIDDANRRKREAEAAHFTECYGTVR